MGLIVFDIFVFVILALITFAAYFYWQFRKSHEFFDKNGIPYVKPTIGVGNLGEVFFKQKSLPMMKLDLYNKLHPHKFAGYFSFHTPFLMIRDPELIKHVMIKDFPNFIDRTLNQKNENENLNNNHLFSLKGDEWRNLRVKLTSTFTSGKMKMMFPLVKGCGDKLAKVLETMTGESFDVKDLCARYTTDVIGTCAFGIETNSLEDPHTEFRTMGNRIFEFRWAALVLALWPNMPRSLVNLLKLRVIAEDVEEFFTSIIESTVNQREQSKIRRQDFVDLLLSLRHETIEKYEDDTEKADVDRFLSQVGSASSKNDLEMTVELMAAQCFIFFGAGFDSAATVLGFLMLELALNQDVQNKLRDEITTVVGNYSEGITYDTFNQLPYTEMVIAEILRKYPSAGFVIRICKEDYQIPNTNVTMPKNTSVTIPILGLHRDPQYYEKPEEFYPEHFTKEAIANRPRSTYMPFGDGPRACIAERFARMQMKVAIISMIMNFSFEISPKTQLPLQFQQHFILVKVKGPLWLQCKRIPK